MKLLGRVLDLLQSANVPHALIGAGAMAVHAVSRATLDLDLLVADRSLLDPQRWGELSSGNVFVEVRRGDSEDPLAGVVRIRETGERSVDVIVGRDAWQDGIIRRAERLTVGELVIPVVRRADLILLKLFAGGSQDAWDIEELLSAADREAVASEVEQRLRELPPDCAALWRRIQEGRRR